MEKALCEAHNYSEATQEKLWDVESTKIHLNKKYMKFIEIGYSFMQATFDNALKHVEFLHPKINMLRENIHAE